MSKTILITGSTDGIGFETAKMLFPMGHNILLHGRSHDKLGKTKSALLALSDTGNVETYNADLSSFTDIEQLVKEITEKHNKLDILINNAGVYSTSVTRTKDDLDMRFMVNTIAPYLLTKRLLPLFDNLGRVVNLSSAAQSPVDINALFGKRNLSDDLAYAQSKLALTIWSRELALSLNSDGPAIIAVNPKSMLGSKMVKQAYGVAGKNLTIGAEILVRAALSDEFANVSGQYYDNDIGKFSPPHPDALNSDKSQEVIAAIEKILFDMTSQ